MMQIATPLGADYLLINKLTASEGLSKLFNFEVELLHDEGEDSGYEPTVIDVSKILGQAVEITLRQRDGTQRSFAGIVNQFSQGRREHRFSYYYATIVPAVWVLTQRQRSRIFQHQSVPEILRRVLADFDVRYEQQGDFKPRNYCVQYRETDFEFVARLMEEEGLYYYFQHGDGTHRMIIGNQSQSNHDCPSKSEIHYSLIVQDEEDFIGSIGMWNVDYRLQTGKYTLRDYHFQTPHKHLEGSEPGRFKVGANEELEVYDYPGGYARKYDGIDKSGGEQAADLQNMEADREQTVKRRMQEVDARYRVIRGLADTCALVAGHRFKLLAHPQSEYNTQYVLTEVTHEIEQTPSYETEEKLPKSYANSFSCIQYTTPYRPEQVTAKPKVAGSQTAVVVGPSGEEIFTDKYGRVKVQFHWDREGAANEGSSCWVRVSQPWAGRNWGSICIPRIGQEVIIDFIEGDPDQPIITGCVYNADQMPPYELPNNAHTMGFKSNTTKGGKGYNEIVIVDDKTNEMVRIHAQKDMSTTVRHNDQQYVVVDRAIKVDGKHDETIKKNMSTIVTEGNQSNIVQAGTQDNIVQKQVVMQSVDNGISILAKELILIESEQMIVLQTGASSIYMNKDGLIEIKGKDIRIISEGPIASVATGDNSVKGANVLLNSD